MIVISASTLTFPASPQFQVFCDEKGVSTNFTGAPSAQCSVYCDAVGRPAAAPAASPLLGIRSMVPAPTQATKQTQRTFCPAGFDIELFRRIADSLELVEDVDCSFKVRGACGGGGGALLRAAVPAP